MCSDIIPPQVDCTPLNLGVIGWVCQCSYLNGNANHKCWKCGTLKAAHSKVTEIYADEIVNGKYIRRGGNS